MRPRRATTLARLLPRYVEAMMVQRWSPTTIAAYRAHLVRFVAFCRRKKVTRVAKVTTAFLVAYQEWAAASGGGVASQEKRTVAVRAFFSWLAREGHVAHDPARLLHVPRRPRRLPRHVLTASAMEKLLSLPDVGTPEGLQDRAILEVLYSTGVRRQELLDLTLADVDAARGVVLVREGKGKKDRVVPIGERALHWLERHVAGSHPGAAGDTRLFPLGCHALRERVRRHLDAIGVPKGMCCHLLRHTMATVMLEHGADVVSVGRILGHARIDTTQLYTHVTIGKLREVHAATHPAERLRTMDAGATASAAGGESRSCREA